MIENKANVFQFATKELSQDAILLYLADCFNDETKKEIGKSFLHKFYGNTDNIMCVYPIKQYHNIDVLIVLELKDRLDFLIIEDKVYSREHSNQLERYKNEITEGNFSYLGIPSKDKGNVVPIYFKPVIFNENEKAIAVNKNNYICKGYEDLLPILYSVNDDPILNSFREFFKLRYERDNKIVHATDIDTLAKQFSLSEIMDSACGQWTLLKLLMQEWDRKYLSGKQHNGSSYGRPWTQYRFVIDFDSKEENWDNLDFSNVIRGKYSYFFRLDREKKGYYLSINQYIWDEDKVDEEKKNERKILTDMLGLKYLSNNHKESKVHVIYFETWEEFKEQKDALKISMDTIIEYNREKYRQHKIEINTKSLESV